MTAKRPKDVLLDGLRVLEVSGSVAVRYAGASLGAMGAQVLSVKADEIDLRHPDIAWGEFLSRGKVPADAADVSGRAFDVCIGDRGPALDTVAGLCPVVAVHWPETLTEYAESVALSSLSGASIALGEIGRSPLEMPDESSSLLVGSVLAGTALTLAFEGDRDAVVAFDPVSVLVSLFEQNATSYAVRDIPWAREGRRASRACGIHPYGLYTCADGAQVVITARSTQDWVDIAEAIGAVDLLTEFPDALAIVDEGLLEAADVRTAEYVSRFTQSELVAIAERTGVLIAPVATLSEVLAYGEPLTGRDYWDDQDGLRMPGLPWAVWD